MTALTHQARVYLAQARATKHHTWRVKLQQWAAKCRREAFAPKPPGQDTAGQLNLF